MIVIEEFKAKVGQLLSEANIYFQSNDWINLGASVAKLWILFYEQAMIEQDLSKKSTGDLN